MKTSTKFLLLALGCWLLVSGAMAQQQVKYVGFLPIDQSADLRLNLMQSAKLDAVGRDPLHLGWYRISNKKLWGWGVLAVGGFIDGACEGFDFDGRKAFERKFGASPYGYAGSKRYELVVDDAIKWDAYHQMDDARKFGYVGGSICLGIGGAKVNTRWHHYLIDAGIGFLVSGFFKSRGMNWIRY